MARGGFFPPQGSSSGGGPGGATDGTDLTITSGDAIVGDNDIPLEGGAGSGAASGGEITGDAGTGGATGVGGKIVWQSGDAGGGNAAGGAHQSFSGTGSGSGLGGDWDSAAGSGGLTGGGGAWTGTGGQGGATSGQGGDATVAGGNSGAGQPGGKGVTKGGTGGSSAAGGAAELRGGTAGGGGFSGGNCNVYGGDGDTDGSGGNVQLEGGGGAGAGKSGGDVFLNAGGGSGGATDGDIHVGATTAVNINIGNASSTTTVTGGFLSTSLLEANTAGSGAPNLITAAESGSVFTNEGSAATNYHTLPTAAAGLWYEFIATDASDLMRITANTGDTISLNGAVSSAAGYIQNATAGQDAYVKLLAVDNAQWVAVAVRGSWDSYDGAALNPATRLHAEFGMVGNSTATATITPGTPVVLGGTGVDGDTRGFTLTTTGGGVMAYDGAATKKFLVQATISMSNSVPNQTAKVYIAKNDTVEADSLINRFVATSSQVGAGATQAIVSLATDDTIRLMVDISGGASPTITITDYKITITSLSNN